jgi:Domain of unknown function (DUF4148)
MNKAWILAIVLASALATPVVSFAQQSNQSNQSSWAAARAKVNAQLAQLEKAGYDPGTVSVYYPADIQAAEARVAAQNRASSRDG